MSYEFTGPGGYFCWNTSGWSFVCDLAIANGWEPLGTVPAVFLKSGLVSHYQEDEYEPQGYFHNDFQRITDRDAHNLRDALLRALENADMEAELATKLRDFVEYLSHGGCAIF